MRKPVVAKVVDSRRLNAMALEAYGEFWEAIQDVGTAVEAGRRLALQADDQHRQSWSAPTAEELRVAGDRAARAVEVVSRSARRWRAELITREWKR